MRTERADAILGRLALADRLKSVGRRGRVLLPDGARRRENSAEHCWLLALIATLTGRLHERAEAGGLLGPAP
jgi:putative hydrolase of HD superfamily